MVLIYECVLVLSLDIMLMTLGLQVQSVVSAEYFPHKGDSRVYIELSGNG